MASPKNAVPRRMSSAILNSLAAGVVPRTGLEYIAIGRIPEIGALMEDLSNVEAGGAAFRLIVGRYGSGKSFLLQLLRAHALERGFAVADADLSPERRLAGSKGQGLATYRELMQNLSTRTAPDGGALPVVLSRWIASIQLEQARALSLMPGDPALAQAVETALLDAVSRFEGLVHGFDFAAAVTAFYRGTVTADDTLKQAALRWLRGEFPTKTEARAVLPVSSVIDDESWYDYLKLMAALMRAAGHKGLIVVIDEAVNLYKIVQSVSRESNYEKILTMFNDAMQGRLSHMGFIFGGTPQFLEDNRRGLYSYEALRSRLSPNRYASADRPDYTGPVLRLAPLTPEELLALLKRILSIHAIHNDWSPPVEDGQLVALVEGLTGRMGADTLLTPREVVRDFTGLLNVMRTNPGTPFDALALSQDMRPADAPADAPKDLFAEFEL